MPQSLSFLEQALGNGLEVIGASSLRYDPHANRYPVWKYLPYISEASFDESLQLIIESNNISAIFSPNIVIWERLNQFCIKYKKVRLLNPNPYDEQIKPYYSALQLAESVINDEASYGIKSSASYMSTKLQIASLIHHSSIMSGMCGIEKISALCNIFPCIPQGDIVEIGVWQGKSAFILHVLSNIYKIGSVLCIDPWSSEEIIQPDASNIVNDISKSLNVDAAFTAFILNILPYSRGDINYIRETSSDASKIYAGDNKIYSPEFGYVPFTGSISLLHIDGNHSYISVSRDLSNWCHLVVSQGWIIFDDYLWAYGSGPKDVADEFIAQNPDIIHTSFVAGGALFLQLV